MKEKLESVAKRLVSMPRTFCLRYYCSSTDSTYREYILYLYTLRKKNRKKKNTEDLRPDRAACSQVACTFKYATLRTRETHDTVTLKKQNDG